MSKHPLLIGILILALISPTSSYGSGSAVVMTDEEMDMVHAGGLNFDFGSFYGSTGNTASQMSQGSVGNTAGVAVSGSSGNVKILQPLTSVTPVVPKSVAAPVAPVAPSTTQQNAKVEASVVPDLIVDPAPSSEAGLSSSPIVPFSPDAPILPQVSNVPSVQLNPLEPTVFNTPFSPVDPALPAAPNSPVELVGPINPLLPESPVAPNLPAAPTTPFTIIPDLIVDPAPSSEAGLSSSPVSTDVLGVLLATPNVVEAPTSPLSVSSVASVESPAEVAAVSVPETTVPPVPVESVFDPTPVSSVASVEPPANFASEASSDVPASQGLDTSFEPNLVMNILAGGDSNGAFQADVLGGSTANVSNLDSGGTNIVNVSELSQQSMRTLVSVNAAGATVNVQLNLVIVYNSQVGIIDTSNVLSNYFPVQ